MTYSENTFSIRESLKMKKIKLIINWYVKVKSWSSLIDYDLRWSDLIESDRQVFDRNLESFGKRFWWNVGPRFRFKSEKKFSSVEIYVHSCTFINKHALESFFEIFLTKKLFQKFLLLVPKWKKYTNRKYFNLELNFYDHFRWSKSELTILATAESVIQVFYIMV